VLTPRRDATGTREAVAHPNYLLIYRVGDGVVEILAVLHTRQQYP
jgi:plasmid stabilization system protein ParE